MFFESDDLIGTLWLVMSHQTSTTLSTWLRCKFKNFRYLVHCYLIWMYDCGYICFLGSYHTINCPVWCPTLLAWTSSTICKYQGITVWSVWLSLKNKNKNKNKTLMWSHMCRDLSNNKFGPSDIPSWFSTLKSLTTL